MKIYKRENAARRLRYEIKNQKYEFLPAFWKNEEFLFGVILNYTGGSALEAEAETIRAIVNRIGKETGLEPTVDGPVLVAEEVMAMYCGFKDKKSK